MGFLSNVRVCSRVMDNSCWRTKDTPRHIQGNVPLLVIENVPCRQPPRKLT